MLVPDTSELRTGLPAVPGGYELRERTVSGPNAVVYRGVARVDGRAVLLTTTPSRPSSRTLLDFSHTPPSGRILVRARRQAEQIEISVLDNGIGIDEAMLRQVFEPFAQGRQALDRAQGGLGLGLAIVRNLITLHGGTIRASSDGLGRGSEFTISLAAIAAPPAASMRSPVTPQVRPDHGGGRVLVVDDNVDAGELLAEFLEACGYRTVVAHDGPSALQAAAELRPQIALLDLGLPVMDGFELAGLLQQQPDFGATRLIAVTGYGQAQDRIKTAAAGFVAHLVKPVDVAQLRSLLEQLLAAPGPLAG